MIRSVIIWNTDIFYPCQSMYRKKHSTQTCLLRMLEDVLLAADHRMISVAIFFYFSKTFNRVQLPILIEKLSDMHFSSSSLAWIRSYLTGRSQVVYDRATDAISASALVSIGVSQESVLDPLFFSLYLRF